jgi:hypothetical protein
MKGKADCLVTDKQMDEVEIELTPLGPETATRQAPSSNPRANHFVADGDPITGPSQNAGPMVVRLMIERVVERAEQARKEDSMTFGDLPRKPNLLLIVTDQEREVMHWPAGWAETSLPARSRLLAHGLQFTRAQCNAAACSASRATFFTGLYPSQHGVKNIIACDNPKDPVQRRLPILPSRLPNLATVLAAAGYHVVLKGKFHLSRPVQYNQEMKRHYWSEADVQHMAERYGFHGWNPPDMSDPQSLSDLGGGAINNDGRFVDGSGTAAGQVRPIDELHPESAVHFLNTHDGAKPFCLIVALVNPYDVQEYPGRGVRGISLHPTFAKV